MVWLVLGSIAAAGLGALMVGRKWGLAVGRRRAEKALEAQAAELRRQQQEIAAVQADTNARIERITRAESPEEVADEVAELVAGWNSGE